MNAGPSYKGISLEGAGGEREQEQPEIVRNSTSETAAGLDRGSGVLVHSEISNRAGGVRQRGQD